MIYPSSITNTSSTINWEDDLKIYISHFDSAINFMSLISIQPGQFKAENEKKYVALYERTRFMSR